MSGLLKMPRVGETMEEGRVVAWLVEPGNSFERGDVLLEVETDKTVVELPALGTGTLITQLVAAGEMVEVGIPIAEIDFGSGPDWMHDDNGPHGEKLAISTGTLNQSNQNNNTLSFREPSNRPRATPVARRLAQKHGIELTGLAGSGRRGRVERLDVEAAVSAFSKDISEECKTGHGLAWSEMGKRGGEAVFFVHGFAADRTAWIGLQTELARSGCHTVAVDLPGHGIATHEAANLDALHHALIDVIRQCFGSAPVHVVAHSMGAIPAICLGKSLSLASLTLIAPAGLGQRVDTAFLSKLSQPRGVEDIKNALNMLTVGSNGLSDRAIKDIYKTQSKGRLIALAKELSGRRGKVRDLCNDLAGLSHKHPVTIIAGTGDQIVEHSDVLSISPLIATHQFLNVGHMPHWEALGDVRTIIERKLKY